MYITRFLCFALLCGMNAAEIRGEETNSQNLPDIQRLIEDLKRASNSDDQWMLDIANEDNFRELRRIIEDHGFNSDELLSDSDFISQIFKISSSSGLFKSGGGTRWTTANFAYQLACYQGQDGGVISNAIWAFKNYNGYGCYCGSGEYKGNFLDGTDYCCKLHDECYARVQKKYKLENGCHTYTTPYSVYCCKDQKITKCTDRGPSAGRELCECDQKMSSCVARNRKTYNTNYYNNRSKCQAGTKPRTAWELLISCKHIFKPRVTLTTTYGSQGSCPAQKKKTSWWWGKKRDE